MKKVFKIAAIVIGVLIVLLLALPFLFRGKIADLVKTEGNKLDYGKLGKPAKSVVFLWAALIAVMIALYIFFNGH